MAAATLKKNPSALLPPRPPRLRVSMDPAPRQLRVDIGAKRAKLSGIQLLMKKCSYCAEEIQDEAIKCKHCLEFLDISKRPPPPMPSVLPVRREEALPWYFRTSFIVLMFVSLPPLALPSVWMHPKLHPVWKVLITLAVAGFCWLSYKAFTGFIHQFDEATKMLNEMKI